MALSIRTNVASLNAQRNLSASQGATESAMARLSSGMRITKASDDAAGLAISSKLQAQIRSFNQAARNANDGLSLIQTAEAALNTTTNLLTRYRELAVQASTGSLHADDLAQINKEVTEIYNEIDRNAAAATFNGKELFTTAAAATPIAFQVGIEGTATVSQISVTMSDMTAALAGGLNLGANAAAAEFADQAGAAGKLATIDAALKYVSTARASLGAVGNRLQAAVENIQTFSESLSAANSRIRDVDVAEESANLARANVLQQAGISVLAQANQTPQMALKLLG